MAIIHDSFLDAVLADASRSGPTRLDSSGGVYKCNPGELRDIHGGARVAYATHTSARRGGYPGSNHAAAFSS
jgi:hypothetical protein